MAIARLLREICTKPTRFKRESSHPTLNLRFSSPLKNPIKSTLNSSSEQQEALTSNGSSKHLFNATLKFSGRICTWGAEIGNLGSPFEIDRRYFSVDSSNLDYSKEVDEINAKFAEAREELEMAMESKETVYFDEEAETARDAVKQTLEMFDALLTKLPEAERGAVQRSMGLKMEQLKAELSQLNE
jgi:hypothetical protein|uniref:Late embryogenesis abundant protein n=1 Tax=Picea sitchensis TaxID=3332 RepID=B8LPL6_PICSI|nr:unknown [Picea sitchensis]